ncbi:MAG TPA: hypothetical protein VK543_09265, partial [Puia sp.]|nr:hypothetical protein [Puia sp.]
MTHLKRILLSANLFLIFSSSNFAQKKPVAEIENMAGGFLRNQQVNSRESIFVHTDKWFYLAGETIWFKAYCINSLSHKIDRKSQTLFLDLVDDNDHVISQLLLNNLRLLTAGNIPLPANLKEGDYWLRAYSMDMLRQDPSQIFVKHVYVFNGGRQGSLQANGDDHPTQLSFFPEGGSLIEGTDQTMAIKTADENGKPISVSGYITNDEDSVKARFMTTAKGLAKFSLYLSPNDRFIAHIKKSDGKELDFPLPEPDAKAARLSVSKETDSSLLLTVALGDSLLKYDAETTVLGFNRDRLCFAATGHGMYELPISKRSFPGGVNNLLLFNKQQLVLSERSFYHDRGNLVVNIKPDRTVYGDREKVTVDINLSDAGKLPLAGLFSVTVTDDNVVTQPPEKDEATSLPSDDVAGQENYTREERELILLT